MHHEHTAQPYAWTGPPASALLSPAHNVVCSPPADMYSIKMHHEPQAQPTKRTCCIDRVEPFMPPAGYQSSRVNRNGWMHAC